jgi:hypothetical protein
MVGSCLLVLAATTRTPPLTPTTPVTAVLTRHGVRGAALARLGRRVPEDTEEAAEALELALGELAAAGVGAKTVARMLTRQPRALPPLLSRCPGPLLAAMAEAGLPPAAELLAAEPLLLSLDPARLQNALSFLAPFVSGSETNQSVSAFVARQPQALLWRSERESPIVVALEEMGLPRRAVRKATTGFKPVHTLASADNARQALCYLRDALHLDLAGLGALVHTFPNILGVSQAKVQPTFDFLVGISDQATAARAVRRCVRRGGSRWRVGGEAWHTQADGREPPPGAGHGVPPQPKGPLGLEVGGLSAYRLFLHEECLGESKAKVGQDWRGQSEAKWPLAG